jgi:HlyD family secretion protein
MMAGTEIMTISDLNEMEARVDIGEVDVVLIAVGQKVRLEVDAFKDRKFEGTVTDIANSAKNNDSGNVASSSTPQEATKFQVKIRVNQEKQLFLPGMSVTAEIETRYRTNVTTVPMQSVTTRLPKGTNSVASGATNAVQTSTNEYKSGDRKKNDDGPKPIDVVFVVDGDHVKVTPVKRGISDDKYWEIVDGVHEGDKVVSGSYKAINRDLEDGVKILEEAAKKDKDTAAKTN